MKEYELSKQDLSKIFKATKPEPLIYLPGGTPMFRSREERANDEWRRLGRKYGFRWDSVRPCPGKGQNFIMAEPIPQKDAAHE